MSPGLASANWCTMVGIFDSPLSDIFTMMFCLTSVQNKVREDLSKAIPRMCIPLSSTHMQIRLCNINIYQTFLICSITARYISLNDKTQFISIAFREKDYQMRDDILAKDYIIIFFLRKGVSKAPFNKLV